MDDCVTVKEKAILQLIARLGCSPQPNEHTGGEDELRNEKSSLLSAASNPDTQSRKQTLLWNWWLIRNGFQRSF